MQEADTQSTGIINLFNFGGPIPPRFSEATPCVHMRAHIKQQQQQPVQAYGVGA